MDTKLIIPNWITHRYIVENVLYGGMGIVFIVSDKKINHKFAIKTFQNKCWRSVKSVERFKREAVLWIKLEKHPNIVQAYWVETNNGQPFVFLEYIPFGSLTDLINKGDSLDITRALKFSINFCMGMNYATKTVPNFVHRDIKPSNCLIGANDTLKIGDFGLAKSITHKYEIEVGKIGNTFKKSDIYQTNTGESICGTIPYMAPELFIDSNLESAKSDIYSFGMLLYEMFAGELCFYGSNIEEWVHFHIHVKPKNLQNVRKNIPQEINHIVLKCLSKNPKERFGSFLEIENLLQKVYKSITKASLDTISTSTKLAYWELSIKGNSLASLDLFEEAIANYKDAIKLNPNYAPAWAGIGSCLDETGKTSEAIVTLEKSISLEKDSNTLNFLSLAYKHENDYEKAKETLKEAISLNPNDPDLWINLGTLYTDMNQIEKAFESYKKAVLLDKNNSLAWNNLGRVYAKKNMRGEATNCYDNAIKINPLDKIAIYNKAIELRKINKIDEALEMYNKAIEIDNNFAYAWFNKGICLMQAGNEIEGQKCMNKAIQIDPRLKSKM